MSLTGYANRDLMSNPAYVIEVIMSPNAVPDIHQIARQSSVTPEQVIDSYVNSGFSFSEMAIEDALKNGQGKINLCYFEECPIALAITVINDEIFALILARYEADDIEGGMQMGNSIIDLDWMNIVCDGIEIMSDDSYQ